MALKPKARMHKLPNDVSVSTGSDHLDGDHELEDTESGNIDEVPSEEKHPYARRLESSFWKSNWIWEILSATASVSAFVAIIIVLIHYDERAIPTLQVAIIEARLERFLCTLFRTKRRTAQFYSLALDFLFVLLKLTKTAVQKCMCQDMDIDHEVIHIT